MRVRFRVIRVSISSILVVNRAKFPILLVGIVVIFFSNMIIGNKSFTSDGQLAAYHQKQTLWSSDWATGWPTIADPVSMPLYPIRLVMVALDMPFDLYVLSAFIIAVLGMYLFLVTWVARWAASFGAVVFALSGWMLVHLPHTSMIHAAAWLPWMMLAVSIITPYADSRKSRGAMILALALAMSVFAGHPQITVYSLFLTSTYGIYMAIANRTWHSIFFVVAGVLLGLGVSAPALMSTAELISFTHREMMTTEELFSYSLPLRELPGLILPLVYGATPYGWFGHDYRTPEYSGETITFLPAIALLLSILAILVSRGKKHHIVFWLVSALFSLSLALGDWSILTSYFTAHIFPLNLFRAPSRHMLEVTLCFSVLSAVGLQALANGEVREFHVKASVFIMVLLFVLSVSAVLASRISLELNLANITWPVLFAFLMTTLSGTLLMLRDESGRSPFIEGLSIIILILHVVLIGYQLPWRVYAPPESHNAPPAWIDNFKDKLGLDYRALGMNGWQSDVFNPDVSRLHGIKIVGWYGPMLNRSFAELSGLTTGGWTQRFVLSDNDVSLDLLSVRYVSISEDEKHLVERHPDKWVFVSTYGSEHVFENRRALPRARLVCKASKIENEAAFTMLVREGRLALSMNDYAFLNGTLIDGFPEYAECSGHVAIQEDNGNKLKIKANVDSHGAILLLSDLWYPGWEVIVNGQRRTLYRVNNTSRGVELSKGTNDVTFLYRPSGWYISTSISVISMIFIVFLSLITTAPRPRKSVPDCDENLSNNH